MQRRRTPQFRRGDIQLGISAAQGRSRSDLLTAVDQRNLRPVPRLRSAGLDSDTERSAIQIGSSNDVANILLRNGFEPYRLPDARYGRIPNDLRVVHLLPARLAAGIRGIPDTHAERVVAFFQNRCDIEFKRRITALVAAQAHAVHPHVGAPVYGSEVQQYPAPAPFRRNRERPFVPQLLLRAHAAPYARER